MFQSLFCWIVLKNMSIPILILLIFNVSILVLLDRIKELKIHCYITRVAIEFQSLFCWIVLKNKKIPIYSQTPGKVSILVLLDRIKERFFGSSEIQRLLYVSILVLLDRIKEQENWLWNRIKQSEFQSLFCWIVLKNASHLQLHLICIGVSILVLLDRIKELIKITSVRAPIIVSILVLLDRIKEHLEEPIATTALAEFQSLFCWIVLKNCMKSKKNL